MKSSFRPLETPRELEVAFLTSFSLSHFLLAFSGFLLFFLVVLMSVCKSSKSTSLKDIPVIEKDLEQEFEVKNPIVDRQKEKVDAERKLNEIEVSNMDLEVPETLPPKLSRKSKSSLSGRNKSKAAAIPGFHVTYNFSSSTSLLPNESDRVITKVTKHQVSKSDSCVVRQKPLTAEEQLDLNLRAKKRAEKNEFQRTGKPTEKKLGSQYDGINDSVYDLRSSPKEHQSKLPADKMDLEVPDLSEEFDI